MNDLSSPVHPPDIDAQRLLSSVIAPDARPSALDRLSLRIGTWLLLRSARRINRSRERAAHPPFDHSTRKHLERQLAERERAHAWVWLSSHRWN